MRLARHIIVAAGFVAWAIIALTPEPADLTAASLPTPIAQPTATATSTATATPYVVPQASLPSAEGLTLLLSATGSGRRDLGPLTLRSGILVVKTDWSGDGRLVVALVAEGNRFVDVLYDQRGTVGGDAVELAVLVGASYRHRGGLEELGGVGWSFRRQEECWCAIWVRPDGPGAWSVEVFAP